MLMQNVYSTPALEHALTSPPSTSPSLEAIHVTEEETPGLEVATPFFTPSETYTPGPLTPDQHAVSVSRSGIGVASYLTGKWSEDVTSGIPTSTTMSLFTSRQQPPKLTLPADTTQSDDDLTLIRTNSNKPLPRSPSTKSPGTSKLGSFFGWGGNTSPASTSTSFDEDRAFSPIPSPYSEQSTYPKTASPTNRTVLANIDIPRANTNDAGYFGNAYLQIPPATPESAAQVDEMEDELKIISAELATSIRREMELEDLVDRLQSEAATQGQGRRTSDYFSDSGTSSVRYGSDADTKTEELERLQRQTEREKATIRLELTDKVQEERSRRKVLESQIRSLEQKASQVDLQSMNNVDANGRLKELENTCEDLRRRLSEERQVKENFEDLLTALKSELQNSHNERDNLRDEVVPQLRARVEGLEAQAAQHEQSGYEITKMQQEMQSLKNENLTLVRKSQLEMQSIAEDGTLSASRQSFMGLSRSNTTSGARNGSRPSSLSRSASALGGTVVESREVLAERVKDIEAQRDALHRALKSLLERQEHQNRTHETRIKQLEKERDYALNSSPKRLGYERDVKNLKEEIATLRRRADEAIEQKWQVEKGLGGINMDLQRAEQEISSLRGMLSESTKGQGKLARSNSVTSTSLERAYEDLKEQYQKALEQIKSQQPDSETEAALEALEAALSKAISERDAAATEADSLRAVNASLHMVEKSNLTSEQALAEELRTSAQRVEDLANQVRTQLEANSTLRQRLAETISRGEKEQKSDAARIISLQARLKSLEDRLIAAQQTNEEKMAAHEAEIKALKASHNDQLSRMRDGLKSPRIFSPKTPMSPLFATTARMPQLAKTSSGLGISIGEESKTEDLKKRVIELEAALEEADKEMEEVVGRMNSAQIEVMELWNEREEAVRVTKRLEKEIESERQKGFQQRWKTLQS